MPSRYLTRSLEPVLHKAARQFPAVILTGPRQSGKTTLLRHLFGKRCAYVSLEAPDIRQAATEDPRGFLAHHPPPVILDEAHNAPTLFPYLQERIDARRDRCGQYILTGSQNLMLTARITESLAGRAAILHLLPLARREIDQAPQAPFPWEKGARAPGKTLSAEARWRQWLRGSYPEMAVHPSRDAHLWQSSYLRTYLERDVRSLRQIGDLGQFQVFLRSLAARNGQLLDLSAMSRDLGVAVNTVKAWLSVLEATHQILLLRPYHANIGKRLVKRPKAYIADVGLLAYLTGMRDAQGAMSGPLAGAAFETAILLEIIKTLVHRGQEPSVYFYRTATGTEVDFVVEEGDRLIPIESKLSSTPNSAMADGIRAFRRDIPRAIHPGYVIHLGEHRLPLGDGIQALPFSEL